MGWLGVCVHSERKHQHGQGPEITANHHEIRGADGDRRERDPGRPVVGKPGPGCGDVTDPLGA
jgi:hypothetical protein